MTNNEDLCQSVLTFLNIAVLCKVQDGTYSLAGRVPNYYNQLFPKNADGSPCTAPWDHSNMLLFFLEEAEAFFESKASGKISTGIWQEDGLSQQNETLLAVASLVDNTPTIIIRCLSDDYTNQTAILQKARATLLEHKNLRSSLAFYKQKSSFDALTSLYNKATFLEIVNGELEQSTPSDAYYSLLMLDIDNFKGINDTYGHQVGDSVLRDIGSILHDSLRQDDVAARYGGEEFIVFAPFTPLTQAGRLAEKLRKRIEGHTFEGPKKVTASIGCTGHTPGDTTDTFIHRADMALYSAKQAGKNTVRLR